MHTSWKNYVSNLCSDAWGLDTRAISAVIQGIDVLIADDQVSSLAVAGVLSDLGVSETYADVAAPVIRATIHGSLRPRHNGVALGSWRHGGARMLPPSP